MKRSFKFTAAAAAILLAGTAMAAAPKAKPHASSAATTATLGGHPNLNGIWQVMSGANFNLEPHSASDSPVATRQLGAIAATPGGLGVVEGDVIPYKPEALAKRDAQRAAAPHADPEAACYLPGIPRATYMPHPFQIVQGEKGDMLFVYEYASANRVVHMQKVEVPPIDTWMGTSYGQWEGDTLKVTTLAENPGDVKLPGGALEPGVTWLDRSGNYLTGTATITEKFKPIDKDHIAYEVTIDDPTIYTRPWKMTMVIYRNIDPNAQLMDFRCVPFSETFLYGDLLADKDKYPKK
ncbi:hypothetical protein [Sphingomonas sp. MMS24-J13]|uniref:hypothetical protein n=1 Tax=Sphingomonas sp. MMS24-J13 TaxID=3238686 RepID=UPI003850156E